MSSPNSAIEPTVEREEVVPLAPRPRLVQSTDQAPVEVAPPAAPAPSRADQAFVGTLAAIGSVLAARLILMIAMLGGIALAVMALLNGSWTAVACLASYAMLILAPLVWLESRQRK